MANKTVSFINIFGLSIAVASCISVFLFLQNYWTLDNYHENAERIFMVEYVTQTDGEDQVWGNPPVPIATALAAEFPQVERVVRRQYQAVKLLNKENEIDEMLTYVDTDFFEMFTFPLKYGDPSALADPSAIILSAEMAEKCFGDKSPIGQSIILVTGEQERKQFTVQGVAKQFPNNSSLFFDLLTGYHPSHSILKKQDWQTRTNGIFVQLRNPATATDLVKQMARFVEPFNAANETITVKSFTLDNLLNPAPKAYRVFRRPAEASHPLLTIIFSFIALTMMALSCFNYINISLGTITRRLKEIGMRKVMGGKRWQLIAQFMAENLLLCIGALTLGLVLAESVFAPVLNSIMVLKIDISFSENIALWMFLCGLLAFSAIASGLYPAFYISAFRPAAIFAGKQKFASKNFLRRGLLSLQFGLAFLAIIITVLLFTSVRHWEKLTWGYNPEGTLVVRVTPDQQFELLKNEILMNSNVKRVAGSVHHVGQSYNRETALIGTQKQDVFRYDIGAGYPEALGLDLQSGRFFEANRRIEEENAIMVNQAFVNKQEWDNAVGQTVRVERKNYTIIGVTADFKIFGTGAVRPSLFFRANESDFSYLVCQFVPGADKQIIDHITASWQRLFSNAPLNYFLQKDIFDNFYRTFRNVSSTIGYISGLALIIACMGLYGLAMQHFSRRLKEMGVRKLLGAPLVQILFLVNREFLVLLLLAGSVTTLVSFMGVRVLLQYVEEFVGPYRPAIMPFLAANLLVLLTAVVAVGRQSWNVAMVNLSEVLKNTE